MPIKKKVNQPVSATTNMVSFNSRRNFGAELEFNSWDSRDFKKSPLKEGELPKGMEEMSFIIMENTEKEVVIGKWHATHNNQCWDLKPDSSCGIEVCSPVLNGWSGLKELLVVVEALTKNPGVKCDERCSFHLHVDVSDLHDSALASFILYWIKCENLFFHSVPMSRRVNKYCESISQSSGLNEKIISKPSNLISYIGSYKYYSLNAWYRAQGNRPTIEFRIMENMNCLDAFAIKNWIRLLLHFIEITHRLPYISEYDSSDVMSSARWLDPIDVFKILNFYQSPQRLSKGMEQTRNWFISRLFCNSSLNGQVGVWKPEISQKTREQILFLLKEFGVNPEECLNPKNREMMLFDSQLVE